MTTRPPGAAPKVVAVIPARGGSQGVPGKNLKKVGGISLVARAVAAATATESIDAVYVSTDDAAIAAAARAAGAGVIDRPADLSGDSASSETALLHALGALQSSPDILVFLQATSPFIEPADLDAAIARVLDGESDVVFSARKTHAFLWRLTESGAVGVNHDASFRLRRQDLEPQFQETGAFYVMRVTGFRASGHRFFGRVGIAIVDELTAVDIDTADDLELATRIAPMLTTRGVIDVDAVVTDFDGVHTDDRVHISSHGAESVTASRADGMGVSLLRRAGLAFLILSSETNPVVSARAEKLMVEAQQSVDDKAAALARWCASQGLDPSRVAYVGNDVNDLGCLGLVGWPIAVADAHPLVLAAARVVLSAKGGHGAIRELADRVLNPHRPGAPGTERPTLEELWSRSRPTR
jgi:YrbI family 3-deoxy-D-manno-octulosonate 8-phosphate phosphatase